MSETQDLVSLSARMAAAVRALETQRADGLFKDPLAAVLAGKEIIAEIEPKVKEYDKEGKPIIAVRTRFFDDFLILHTEKIQQVVILGAGMDTRAFRLPWKPNTHLYELDRREILEYKNSVLGNTPSECSRYSLGVDITELWADLLLAKGYKLEIPTVWLAEGLLYYLNETEVHQLLRVITQLSISGSWFLADIMNSYLVSQRNEPLAQYFKYECDEPEKFFSIYGWDALVVQAGDEGANFGRFTLKFPPREVYGPHYFFVKALLK
ncbi:SAM-dependent methyltransferase (plasmid) [Nostoc sp. UHCC 0302]|uniref:SAM-dependent methyltransferase n=1 Tax=Nostoc sp. UHCC 0302 TaxID=3134896 RepID=UPI00311C9412